MFDWVNSEEQVIIMERIYKYPRTRHLEGSKEQLGDEDLKCVKFGELQGKYLVLEEKVDGANCGISFGADGKMYLQSRGHFLNGGYGERQFDLFKLWAGCFESRLRELLSDRYVMYAGAPFICSVRVLDEGYYKNAGQIADWIGPSRFISEEPRQSLLLQCQKNQADPELVFGQTDLTGIMEGIYIKVEDGEYVTGNFRALGSV